MTPNARIAAAIDILDAIVAGKPAEQALLRWARSSRFAGSGDRAAVRDLVFDNLRRRRSRMVRGGAESGRGLILGWLREEGRDPEAVFTGAGHDPQPLRMEERESGDMPTETDLLDLPDWLLPYFAQALGQDLTNIANLSRDRAPVWLRVNLAAGTSANAQAELRKDDIITTTGELLSSALMVTDGARKVAASSAYKQGLVELQDLSPQLACAAVPLQPGDRVLDFCAGGGGKSLALASREKVTVVAHDAEQRRMEDLPSRAKRAGVKIDMSDQPAGKFDVVVTDVPCSGSGTWRRAPDAKWRLTSMELDRLTSLQDKILRQASGFVRPGGHLAYMTCSYFVEENRSRVNSFLSDRPEFSLSDEAFYTPLKESDGFYLAVLSRAE